jgi:hypothetical protein
LFVAHFVKRVLDDVGMQVSANRFAQLVVAALFAVHTFKLLHANWASVMEYVVHGIFMVCFLP